MAPTRVVVVEDEHLVRRKLAFGLQALGFRVFEAADAYACRALMACERTDVVLLDLGLPGVAGLTFARELRARSDLPLIVVSREDDPGAMIEALDVGCDDFLVKPVHVGELAARIRSVLRRRGTPDGRRTVGPWTLDFDARTAVAEHGAATLTRGEFEILQLLVRAGGKIVSRSELIAVVSRNPGETDVRTVDALVSRLRRKLACPAGGGELIATCPGLGYRLSRETEPARAT